MLDLIYRTLQTIINKENNGYVSPDEFNLLAHTTQLEIYRGYFDDENKAKNRQNRGVVNRGYANLAAHVRERVEQFAAFQVLTFDVPTQSFTLPTDLYLLEENGITTTVGRVIEEVERTDLGYMKRSSASPSEVYPVFERYNKFIRVSPATITTGVECRYLRNPLPPKWTFVSVGGSPMFNPAATDFQDFELHPSEFTNVLMKMLTYFGINLREAEVVQIAETLKDKTNIKEST